MTYKIQLCTKKTYKVNVVLKKDLIVLVVVVVVVDMTSDSSKKLLVSNNSRTSTYGHPSTMVASPQCMATSMMATYLCPGRQSIQCVLFKPLNNGHLSKTAMAQQPVFSATDGKSGMDMKFHSHGALMINHSNHILIVFHLYCCSKYIIILSKVNSFWQILIADLSTIYFVCLSIA